MLLRVPARACSTDGKLYPGHVPTSFVQKAILGVGSAVAGLTDPWRADMVAVNGEVTGQLALASMRDKMRATDEGRRILKDRPRINTHTVDFDALKSLPETTVGHAYAAYCARHGIGPDSRDAVRFVDDAELAYVMTRYRETHDVTHAMLDLPTNLVGEVGVKWVEALQFGLPMAVGGALLAPMRFSPRQMRQWERLRPYAVEVGKSGRFLLSVYYEERWEQDLDEFRKEMNIGMPPKLYNTSKKET